MISSYIITGFLGVGKSTTLLNNVQKHFGSQKTAIIVNELGDVGIDGKLLSNTHSEVLEIAEGCICCSLAHEFEQGVLEIIEKHQPELLFVETSGASEPFPIFSSLHALGISIEGVLCIVDAKNFHTYKDNLTAKYQIGGSNIIVLNKTDLVNHQELEDVKQEVQTIKKQYDVKNDLTGQKIFKHHYIYETEHGLIDKAVFEGVYKLDDLQEFAKASYDDGHAKQESISQMLTYLKEGVSTQDITTLLQSLPSNIYRAKGVAKVSDRENPILINFSYGSVTYEELSEDVESSILVFIGEDVKKDVNMLATLFSYLLVPQFRVIK